MRIHSDYNLAGTAHYGARVAGAEIFDIVVNDSRSHNYGMTVKLTGSAPNRPNGWDRDRDGDVRAASWDQWGIFLSILFDRDPEMVVGSVGNPTYNGVYDFDRKTGGRFYNGLGIAGQRVPIRHLTDVAKYVPADMHHRHTFDYTGELATGGAKYRCRKCTAAKVVTR